MAWAGGGKYIASSRKNVSNNKTEIQKHLKIDTKNSNNKKFYRKKHFVMDSVSTLFCSSFSWFVAALLR